jgi:hypothetical protein
MTRSIHIDTLLTYRYHRMIENQESDHLQAF